MDTVLGIIFFIFLIALLAQIPWYIWAISIFGIIILGNIK